MVAHQYNGRRLNQSQPMGKNQVSSFLLKPEGSQQKSLRTQSSVRSTYAGHFECLLVDFNWKGNRKRSELRRAQESHNSAIAQHKLTGSNSPTTSATVATGRHLRINTLKHLSLKTGRDRQAKLSRSERIFLMSEPDRSSWEGSAFLCQRLQFASWEGTPSCTQHQDCTPGLDTICIG